MTSDLVKEMGQNFIEYAVACNSDRAIPDAKSGLKPVAKRILYGAFDEGYLNNKAHVKCANIVGNVMAEFHPHGDSSIYGALVRLAQPWVMRYPLIDFHGSMGNRDGDGPAAYRYCITGDSLINTNKGLIPIKDLSKYTELDGENFKEEIFIIDYKGNKAQATKFFNSGKHSTYTVTLRNGQKITGTSNHPLMILDEELNFGWKTIEQLNIGDKILLPHFNQYYYKEEGDIRAKALGALVSEGYLTTQNRIGISNTDLNIIQPVKDWFEQLFPELKAKINYNEKRLYYEYCVANSNLYAILVNKYNYAKRAEQKTIPLEILKDNKANKSAFLSYLFEGDGGISGESIVYSSYSEKLISQIQILLLSEFNIFSNVVCSKKRKEYKLYISGQDLNKFRIAINFVSERKQSKLLDIIQLYEQKSKIANNSFYNIPEISSYVRKLNSNKYTNKHSFSNKKNYFLSQEYIDPLNYIRLEELINNYMYIPIQTIEKNKNEEEVFSIRVDNIDSDHSFIANGFINHNTEARLAKITEDGLLCGIKKKNVDFVPNYSETKDEPVTLPSLFPNLLCNPNTGIGVAVASNWLPHNLREVAQAIYDYMDGKEPSLPGPDFPTGGLIINAKEVPNMVKTGHGSVKIRGKYKIEDNNIVFYEIPYGVATEDLMTEIGTAADQGKISGIKNIRNESNRKSGFRLVIECDKNASINTIISLLFKETNLQTSISYNQVALVDKTPTELGLKDCIKIYIDHNISCISRETEFDLNKAKNKLEIINGLLKALEDIDNIISLIKKSESSNAAKISLQQKYGFTEAQSKAIVDMKLGRLAGLERIELQNEAKELEDLINSLINILQNPLAELRNRLTQFVKIYGDDRRTELTQLSIDKESKEIEFVEPEKCVVVMTEGGTIKRIPSTSFRTQRKNGKGVRTQEDITSVIIRTNTIDSLMIFTNKGKMYRLLVDNIPIGTNVSKGALIKSLVPMEADENPETIYSIYRDTDAKYVLFTTKKGLVKKTTLDEYINTRKKTGIDAISLKEGDSISSVSLIKDEPLIFITANGQMLKCDSLSIGASSRKTQGVKAMNLAEDDYIVATLPVRDSSDCIAIFSEHGSGKRISQSEILSQNRGGKGLTCHKWSDKVSAAALVSEDDLILVCGDKSSICIKASELPIVNRTSAGSQIIKNNIIKSVSKV